jgi:hypothetical protein
MPDDPAKAQAAMQPLIMRYAVDQSGRKLSERLRTVRSIRRDYHIDHRRLRY